MGTSSVAGSVGVAALALAGCCHACPRAPRAVSVAPPPAVRGVPSAPTRLDPPPHGAQSSPSSAELVRAVARVRAATDDAGRRAAVVDLRSKARDSFLALAPDVLADLAPASLRVYDLSEALAEGGDAAASPVTGRPPVWEGDPAAPTVPVLRRAHAIAAAVRAAVGPGTAAAPASVDVRPGAEEEWVHEAARACLVVLADAEGFVRAEAALDRVARAGGPVVHVEVELLSKDRATVVRGSRMALDVPRGREVAGWQSTSTRYLQDYDVEVGTGNTRMADPVVGTVVSGSALRAAWTVEEGRPPRLRVRCDWAELRRPIATFDTTLPAGPGGVAVRIDLPEVRLRTLERTIDVPSTRVELTGDVDPLTFGRLTATPANELATPDRRGWSRVLPGEPALAAHATVDPRPIVTVDLRWEGPAGPLSRSSLSVFAGQTGAQELENRISHLQDFDVDARTQVADPVIGVVTEALAVRVLPLPSPTGGPRIFEGTVRTGSVDDPMRVGVVRFTSDTPHGLVQLPVTHEEVRPFRVRLAPGEEARIPFAPQAGDPQTTARSLVLRYVADGADPAAGSRAAPK